MRAVEEVKRGGEALRTSDHLSRDASEEGMKAESMEQSLADTNKDIGEIRERIRKLEERG